MKKLVVMGLAMAMTAAMVNGVCTQPVQAADGEGLKVALLLSGAANDQGWNQTAYEGTQKACEKYGYELDLECVRKKQGKQEGNGRCVEQSEERRQSANHTGD